ncbi:MAG: 2-oxoacid:ferredoxin oxidoreductase subunit beta, partial [Thermoplasmataceae archaeon]
SRDNMFGRVNPIALALTSGYSFVARGFSFDMKQLKELIKRAIMHEGSSVIDILQPCPTYNNINSMEWYKQRVYKLEDDKTWDPVVNQANKGSLAEKFHNAYNRALEWGDKIPTGIFYDDQTLAPFTKRINNIVPSYLENPPAMQAVSTSDGYSIVDPMKTFADKIIR